MSSLCSGSAQLTRSLASARDRGPVVCSRIKSNLPIRNSIGAHAGSYSIYRALSIAMGQLRPDWRPDLTNTHVSGVLSLAG